MQSNRGNSNHGADTFLPKAGGYRNLKVYRLTEIILDLTYAFVEKNISRYSRTCDQMQQAARSGKQNIAEGSVDSKTSKKTEIKLTNVAKGSLEELLLDYEDFLRIANLEKWGLNHPRISRMREYLKSDEFLSNPFAYVDRMDSEEFANMMLTLIHQAIYMLDKLIESQEKQFLQNGGISEQMMAARLNARHRDNNSNRGN